MAFDGSGVYAARAIGAGSGPPPSEPAFPGFIEDIKSLSVKESAA